MQILPEKNLAPVKPLYSLVDKSSTTPSYLATGLKELFDDIMGRDADTFREIIDTTEITSNFIQGKQTFQQTTSGWRIQNIRRADPNKIRAINVMQYFCSQNVSSFTASNPDIEPAEYFKQIQYKDKVRKAAAIWNSYEKKFYTKYFNQQEALHAIISGTYLESVRYDNLVQGARAFKEIWGETEVPISDGQGRCFTCEVTASFEAFGNEMPRCPECGSFEVQVEEPMSQLIPSVVGMEPINMGELTLKLIPIQAARFDVRGRAEDSPYFIERMEVPKSKLELLLGTKLNLDEAPIDSGLRSLNTIATAGNTLFGADSYVAGVQPKSKNIIIDRMSLSPEMYWHIKAKAEQTVSGETVPAERMADFCPNGATVIGVNGCKHILGIYPNVHHSQEITSGVYHMRLNSGVGRGSEDAVEIQKGFNRQNAQMVRAGETGATPAHFHVEGAVDRKHIKQIGMPGVSVPIKQEVVQALGTTDLIRQIQPASIAGTYFQYTYEILDKYRQMVSHAPDLSNSLLGAKSGGTATEARISDSNAEKLINPMLDIKADVRCGTADKTLKLYNQHFKGISKFFTYGTTKQNIGVGEHIKGEDVDPEIEFVVVADSQRPKTRYGQQTAFAAVMEMSGGAAGLVALKEQAPDLLNQLLKTFDVQLDVDDYDSMEDLCWLRLQQALELVNPNIAPEEMLLEIRPLITPYEPNHQGKATWYQEYLDCPEGVKLDEIKRAAIFALIMAHRNGGVVQAGNTMQASAEAQAIGAEPLMAQQSEMVAQQQEHDVQMQQMQDESQTKQQMMNDANAQENAQETHRNQQAQLEQKLQFEREKLAIQEKADAKKENRSKS